MTRYVKMLLHSINITFTPLVKTSHHWISMVLSESFQLDKMDQDKTIRELHLLNAKFTTNELRKKQSEAQKQERLILRAELARPRRPCIWSYTRPDVAVTVLFRCS